MKGRGKKHSAFYEYLEPYLENGDEKQIALARKQYTRQYKAEWRRQKRKEEKELTTSWAKDELKTLSVAAKKHRKSKTSFIKLSTLAYINKAYIVPDNYAIRGIAQLLTMVYNSIREMTDENALPLQTGKLLLEKIVDLERQVFVSLHNPKTLGQLVTEEVNKNPKTKEHLYQLLETFP